MQVVACFCRHLWGAWLSFEVQRHLQGEQLQAWSEHPALSKTHLTKGS